MMKITKKSSKKMTLRKSHHSNKANANVLISGLGGLGVEVAKNVILGGVKSVTLLAECYMSNKEYQKVIFLLKSPQTKRQIYLKSLAYFKLDKDQKANQCFENYFQGKNLNQEGGRSSSCFGYSLMGRIKEKLGLREQALKYHKMAYECNPIFKHQIENVVQLQSDFNIQKFMKYFEKRAGR